VAIAKFNFHKQKRANRLAQLQKSLIPYASSHPKDQRLTIYERSAFKNRDKLSSTLSSIF